MREAGEADRPFIDRLGKATVLDSVPSFRTANLAMSQKAFERMTRFVYTQGHRALIAERGGRALGFLLMLPDMPDESTLDPQAFIAYMAVEPSSRRSGVGAALLKAAERAAREYGAPYLALMVTEENSAARNLYEDSGYFTERRLLCKIL